MRRAVMAAAGGRLFRAVAVALLLQFGEAAAQLRLFPLIGFGFLVGVLNFLVGVINLAAQVGI